MSGDRVLGGPGQWMQMAGGSAHMARANILIGVSSSAAHGVSGRLQDPRATPQLREAFGRLAGCRPACHRRKPIWEASLGTLLQSSKTECTVGAAATDS